MENNKITISFINGNIHEKLEKYSIEASSVMGTAQIFSAPIITQNKLNGKIIIEIESDEFYATYDVKEKEFLPALKEALKSSGNFLDRKN